MIYQPFFKRVRFGKIDQPPETEIRRRQRSKPRNARLLIHLRFSQGVRFHKMPFDCAVAIRPGATHEMAGAAPKCEEPSNPTYFSL